MRPNQLRNVIALTCCDVIGIGLALCKNLSNLMGAHVRLDDSFHSGIEGCPGTLFVINLNQSPISVDHDTDEGRKKKDQAPLLNGTQSTIAAPTEQSQDPLPQHLHVLFVDDDMILRRMFIRALKRTCPSWHIDEASNGETSLRLIETKRYDLIFMDQYVSVLWQSSLGLRRRSYYTPMLMLLRLSLSFTRWLR